MRLASILPVLLVPVLLASACGDSTDTPVAQNTTGGSATGGAGGEDDGGVGGDDGGTSGGGGASGGAGGAGGGGGGGNDPEQAKACEAYWTAYCTAWESCFPIYFQMENPDLATCVARGAFMCQRSTFGPGSTVTPTGLEACAKALDLTCDGFTTMLFENEAPPPECAFQGTRAAGETCLNGAQCQSGVCMATSGTNLCGACFNPLPLGAECNSAQECEPGLACSRPQNSPGTCVNYVGEGEACGIGVASCHAEFVCSNGTCAPRPGEGEACSGFGSCMFYKHVCNSLTMMCEPLGLADLGEPCGSTLLGGFDLCTSSSTCEITNQQTFQGTCAANVPDGESCTSSFLGPTCHWPAYCNDKNTCKQPDAFACEKG